MRLPPDYFDGLSSASLDDGLRDGREYAADSLKQK